MHALDDTSIELEGERSVVFHYSSKCANTLR
jgi:hypothetical protein